MIYSVAWSDIYIPLLYLHILDPFPMLDIVFLRDSFSKGCGIAWVDYCGILFCNRNVKNVKIKNNLICDSVCFFL